MSETSVSETKTGTESRANDCSISVWKAQVWAALLVFPIFFVCVLPYLILWGNDALDGALDSVHGGVLIGLFIGGIVVHEVLHGIGWALAGGRGWTAISFGFKLKSLTPYAHVEDPMEAWAYRVGAALPGVALGLLPWGISLLIGDGALHLFGAVFTVAAVGDAMVLWLLRGMPGDTLVEDHPDRVGCLLAGKEEASPEGVSHAD